MFEAIHPLSQRLVDYNGEKLLPLELTTEELTTMAQLVFDRCKTQSAGKKDIFLATIQQLVGKKQGELIPLEALERRFTNHGIILFDRDDPAYAVLSRPRGLYQVQAPGYRLKIHGYGQVEINGMRGTLEKAGFPTFRHPAYSRPKPR